MDLQRVACIQDRRPQTGGGPADVRRPRRSARGRPPSLAVVLLALGLWLPAAGVAAERQAMSDTPPSPSAPDVTTDRLIEATLGSLDLPSSVDTLALTGVIFLPGTEISASAGTHLFFVEFGALVVQTYARLPPPPTGTPGPVHTDAPAGPPTTYSAGEQFLAYYDVASPTTIANEGEEPVVALVVSLAVTGGAGIAASLTGSADVYPLAVEDAARVGPPLIPSGGLGAEPLVVTLERRTYERDETDRSIPPPFENAAPAARLIAVEAGTLNVRVGNDALCRPADAAPQALPAGARISLTVEDQLLVLAPGRIAIRNVERGRSEVLIVSVGEAQAATAQV